MYAYSTSRKRNRIFAHILSIFAILAIAIPVTQVAHAASSSPFVGHWQATDVDGSDIRLTIGGPPSGPFQITWTESYISFCNLTAGILRGTGQLNESNPNLLEADLRLDCFTTGAALDFHLVWRYHPMTNTLSGNYDNGVVTVWHRPGQLPPPPPALDLRVNYGDDWVESFYEGGHMAWITVTESDGVTVKATAELTTEPKDFWGGETGFQTRPEDWIPAPPEIQPNDRVFGWLDNGTSAQVQIGEIRGMINLAADSIEGTISAPWFSSEVEVECHSWGAPLPEEILKYDTVQPDGEGAYSCSWAGEWDIQPDQDIGVGYYGPDGHWVATAITAPNPRIVASAAGDWFWTTGFYPGLLNLFIYESEFAGEGTNLLWSGQQDSDPSGFVLVGSDVHGQDLVPGNYLVVSDGVNEKGLVLETITMDVFDTENEIMAGTAPQGSQVSAAAGPQDWQERITAQADPENGAWSADFKTIGFDITEDMRMWSFAQIFDEDGDANEAGTPPVPPPPVIFAHPAYEVIEGTQWTPGVDVTVTVDDPANGAGVDYSATRTVADDSWVRFELAFDLQAGHEITMTDGRYTQTMVVSTLRVTGFNLDAHTVSGVGDPGTEVLIADNGMTVQVDNEGNWSAAFDTLLPGSWWTVIQTYPDGNEVRETFRAPLPVIFAHPAYNLIEGHEWTPRAEVTITIDDPANGEGVDYTQTAVASDNINYLYDTGVKFELAFDLKAGDKITMTDGHYTQAMVVSTLRVTGFDLDAHTVFGVGDPGSDVLVADNGMSVPVDENGKWSAAFDNLLPGSWWTLIQTYPDKNEVRETFRAPQPMMIAWKNWDDVAGSEWTPGAEVTLTIDDPSNGLGVDYTYNQVASASGNPYYGEVYFEPDIELQTGYVLTMTDGNFTKTLVIAALTVTGFDFDKHIVYGAGDSGAALFVHIGGLDSAWTTVGEDLSWSVYQEKLEPGAWGDAIQPDEDGDQTRDGFQALSQ